VRVVLLLGFPAFLVLFTYAVVITTLYVRRGQLMRGLDEPELWLPRNERRAHARKLLRREDEQYIQKMIERQTSFITNEGDTL
jgi:hypothetical protein